MAGEGAGAVGGLGALRRRWWLVLALLGAWRLLAARNPISDCDEAFNFWEPMHYLMYGRGLQTWEYSPVYAIRSYAYIALHAVLGRALDAVLTDKVAVFFALRACLGLLCAACETYFVCAIAASRRLGTTVATLTLGFLLMSQGMSMASTALLPSSTSMYTTLLAYGGWLRRRDAIAVLATAVGGIVAWPFSAALGLPIALDVCLRQRRLGSFVKWCIVALSTILIPLVAVDSSFYNKLVVAPFNIVLYNVLSSDTSSELYGTEPWSFYFKNGALNFNVAFGLALVSLPLTLLRALTTTGSGKTSAALDALLLHSPLFIWLAIFLSQAHKEERFLAPAYGFVCLCAASSLDVLSGAAASLFPKAWAPKLKALLCILVLCGYSGLSVSRHQAIVRGYSAPYEVYSKLATLDNNSGSTAAPATVCVGKEWYRFPSSFFLPEDRFELQFIKSGYDGLLPKHFSAVDGTSGIPSHMNNLNEEEPSRYVEEAACDYLVDLITGEAAPHEPVYHPNPRWEAVLCVPFLDAAASHPLFRAFYVPGLSPRRTAWKPYCLLRAVRAE